MIHLVNSENQYVYGRLLRHMYRHRRRVYLDGLGWDAPGGLCLERDRFDCEEAIYLLNVDEELGDLVYSVRLYPMDRPSLFTECFAQLCTKNIPCDSRSWEVSRFCPNPELKAGHKRLQAFNELICGITECALHYGWENLVLVADSKIQPRFLGCGWSISPLGPDSAWGAMHYRAFAVDIDQEGLRAVRAQAACSGPLLHIYSGPAAVAARGEKEMAHGQY